MQCTEKYFEADAFRTRAESVLLAAVPDSRTGGGLIALEGTVFYPEGGGQPADRGTLTLPDGTELAVTDVHEQDGILWHSVPSLPDTAVPGITVEEAIDWNWRFDKMQQHTGEHILSGILHRIFGAENVGFHIGAEAVRMDTSVPISAEGLRAAELEANRIVWQDVPVVITYPTPQELAALTYRSKKEIEGQVRIVTIPGADVCACCGTHVAASGQVGLVKFLSCQKLREGVRLELLCGGRAMDYLSRAWDQSRLIGQALSVKPLAAFPAVQRLEGQLRESRERCAALEEQSFRQLAERYQNAGNVLLVQPDLEPDSVRRLMDAVSKTCGGLAAVFAGEEGHYAYALGRADGQDISPLVKAMNTVLHGRGGGRNGFAQGSVETERSAIESFFKENGYGICN